MKNNQIRKNRSENLWIPAFGGVAELNKNVRGHLMVATSIVAQPFRGCVKTRKISLISTLYF